MRSTLIDAGPLIALFDMNDAFHSAVMKFTKQYKGKFLSTWPVVTEASRMLSFNSRVQIDFFTWMYKGGVQIFNFEQVKLARMIELFHAYSDLPIDLADSSLLILSEETGYKDIATIDSDFYVYRLKDSKPMRNILEPFLNAH